jgi:hypothetical protein
VKYTCDASWNLLYEWVPNTTWAFKFLWADKENCFVWCEKPSTCSTPPLACVSNYKISLPLVNWPWSAIWMWDQIACEEYCIEKWINMWALWSWWALLGSDYNNSECSCNYTCP